MSYTRVSCGHNFQSFLLLCGRPRITGLTVKGKFVVSNPQTKSILVYHAIEVEVAERDASLSDRIDRRFCLEKRKTSSSFPCLRSNSSRRRKRRIGKTRVDRMNRRTIDRSSIDFVFQTKSKLLLFRDLFRSFFARANNFTTFFELFYAPIFLLRTE